MPDVDMAPISRVAVPQQQSSEQDNSQPTVSQAQISTIGDQEDAEGESDPDICRSTTPTPQNIGTWHRIEASAERRPVNTGRHLPSLPAYIEEVRRDRDRRNSLSIHSLVSNTAIEPPPPRSARSDMDFGLSPMHLTTGSAGGQAQREDGMPMYDSLTPYLTGSEFSQSPHSATHAAFASPFGSHSSHLTMDHESITSLSAASRATSMEISGSRQTGYESHHSDMFGSVSPYPQDMDRSSSHLSLTSAHGDWQSGQQQAPPLLTLGDIHSLPEGMILGRTRSSTIQKYNALRANLSVPYGEESAVSPADSSSLHAGSDRGARGSSICSSIAASDVTSSSTLSIRKKRNKCSPEQLKVLEAFFAKNRNPTGKIREELARSIRMPDRSVQVWFQNKRAKTKSNEIKEGVPPELRTTVSKPKPTPSGSSSKGESSGSTQGTPGTASRSRKTITQRSSIEESVTKLPVVSLCIGEWRRVKPLICLFSRRQQAFTWYLSSESVGFKLECPRSCVTKIVFDGPRAPTLHEFSEGINAEIGHLTIHLDRPPQFYMEVFRSSGASPSEGGKDEAETSAAGQDGHHQKASWRQCSDFTEGKQATDHLAHVLTGSYVELRLVVLQLLENGGPLSQLIQMPDEKASQQLSRPSTAPNATDMTSQESQMSHGGYSVMSDQTADSETDTAFTYAGATSSFDGSAFGHQTRWVATTTAAGAWGHHAGFDDPDMAATNQPQGIHGYSHSHPSMHLTIHPSGAAQTLPHQTVPTSAASSLDMTGLRLDPMGGMSSDSHDAAQQPSLYEQQSPALAWPRTSFPVSHEWTGELHSPTTAESGGFATAPPYAYHSFQQQQGQAHAALFHQQHQRNETVRPLTQHGMMAGFQPMATGEEAQSTDMMTDPPTTQDGAHGHSTSFGGGAPSASDLHNNLFAQPMHVAAAAAASEFTPMSALHGVPTAPSSVDNDVHPSQETQESEGTSAGTLQFKASP